jgi:hypothetical protein
MRTKRGIVAACADTMFVANGPIPASGTEAGLLAYVAAFRAAMPLKQRLLISLLFLFIELSPFVIGPVRSRFTRLAPSERKRVLSAMAVSPRYFFRAAFISMSAIMTMGYFACTQVEDRIVRKGVKKNDSTQNGIEVSS